MGNSFRLFDIRPNFMDISEHFAKPRPRVPQHCTRGHSWDVGIELIGVSLDLSSLGITDGVEEFCLFCLRDNLREHCGRVKDGAK